MNESELSLYQTINAGTPGFLRTERGIIAVSGTEAEKFLNGLITNDVAKLGDGEQMLAAFPNAQGRLIAMVRVRRSGETLLFETDEQTHEAVYQNLVRFTFAGDFFVADQTEESLVASVSGLEVEGALAFTGDIGTILHFPRETADSLIGNLQMAGAVELTPAIYEVLRIERGVPLMNVDMTETTIVPELGIDGLISYNKGCYIGQEIIARIYFRGHVAKQLRGLIISESTGETELVSTDGKPAGKITSRVFSPRLEKEIALAYVRYDYLAAGTELRLGNASAVVTDLPFAN